MADLAQSKTVTFLFDQKNEYNFLRYIEIWENTGDLTDPNYQGAILNTADDYEFDNYYLGEIIRINHDQCETATP